MNFLRLSCALVAAGALGSAALADSARVRVVHASPDAPAVDVLVDGAVAFGDLAFNEATGYASLPAGTYDVQVTPAGLNEIVVIDASLALDGGVDYTVVAIGELASIAPLVLIDDNALEPSAARIRFVHASPDAPAVDIALANGGPVLFGNVSFGESGGYIAVPGGSYDLEVRLAGTMIPVLGLPGIAVENNTVYTAFATGFAAGDPALGALLLVDSRTARVRAIHASPDAPAVDVLVDGAPAITSLAFTQASTYLQLPPDEYDFAVTPAGVPGIAVISASVALDSGTDYSIVAIGELASIAPLVLIDDNTLDPENARIRFVHASPDAPAVDIALADGGPVLFGNIAFTEVGDYLAVPGGTYDLEVRVAGTGTVVLPLPGIAVESDTVYTVLAMGFAFGKPGLEAVIVVDNVGAGKPGNADLDGNGVVDSADLGILLGNWGRAGAGDLDGNGVVDGADLGLLLSSWT
ncbi:MAG TPA: DUF4397 domain-containing protein [Phycisphaerales bacterium]|nr:DUF4397 domain-containing protein [Phycisphaerales bacterium]HMP36329.1 DUF4397 domain-containing protein [Phycisphaerales bacterium]